MRLYLTFKSTVTYTTLKKKIIVLLENRDMTTERIKEMQQETAYPESVSVQQALLKVWNECE